MVRLIGRIAELFLADFSLDTLDKFDDLLVFLVAEHNTVQHILVGNFVSTCFDHCNLLVCGCNCNSHFGNLSLLSCGVDNKLAAN